MEFNTGLKLAPLPLNAFVAGTFSPLIGHRRANEATGFWKNYLPTPEVQNSNNWDEMNCTIRATLNCLEVDYKFQTGTEINWSDRFVSKTSGNTKDGNYVHKPAEAIKEKGNVLETEYPNQAPNWDVYYQTIPTEVLEKGKTFLKDFTVDREFIFPSQDHELLYQMLMENPLGVTVRYASSANPEDILNPQGTQNHMVMIYGAKKGEYWEIFDHYAWFVGGTVKKRYAWNYPFGSALRFHLTKKSNLPYMFKENHPYLLVEGNEQKFGFFLDGKMRVADTKADWSVLRENSDSRLGRHEIAKPVTLEQWNSVPHVNMKGESI